MSLNLTEIAVLTSIDAHKVTAFMLSPSRPGISAAKQSFVPRLRQLPVSIRVVYKPEINVV